jgi:pSer/pThr/pTyr-binding forkhead associated (FHA) protein
MDVKLIIVGGKRAGEEVPVPPPKFFVGRAEDCHLRPQSELVSRHHCVIMAEEGFVAVRDFGSRNGTYVNDQRIKAERELKDGDRLRIGPLDFLVRIAVELAGKKKPKVHTVQEAAARTRDGVKPAGDELDIDGWLVEEQEASPRSPHPDTTALAAAPTTDTDAGKAAAAPAEEPKKKPDEKTKRVMPPRKPSSTQTSGSAAADVLRQFFTRKR